MSSASQRFCLCRIASVEIRTAWTPTTFYTNFPLRQSIIWHYLLYKAANIWIDLEETVVFQNLSLHREIWDWRMAWKYAQTTLCWVPWRETKATNILSGITYNTKGGMLRGLKWNGIGNCTRQGTCSQLLYNIIIILLMWIC